jgi:5'-AMP-activated protein kinase catalytic alpha subunit
MIHTSTSIPPKSRPSIKKSPFQSPPKPNKYSKQKTSPQQQYNRNKRGGPPKKTIGQYELLETLGQGTFGKVKRGVHIVTKQEVAIKIIDKNQVREQNMGIQIKREVNILKQMSAKKKEPNDNNSNSNCNCNNHEVHDVSHSHVVKLYEVLASKSKIYLILEFIKGGELFDKIVKVQRFTESMARFYFRQLVTGVEMCHKWGVCHRDLKPENLLLDENDNLKISDFGLSALYTGGGSGGGEGGSMVSSCRAQLLHTTCGTPNYVSPEVLQDDGYDGRKADVWSMGVILYVLVVGVLPFDEKSLPKLFAKIQIADYPMPTFLSSRLQNLISSILVTNPDNRVSISEIKAHPWYCCKKI